MLAKRSHIFSRTNKRPLFKSYHLLILSQRFANFSTDFLSRTMCDLYSSFKYDDFASVGFLCNFMKLFRDFKRHLIERLLVHNTQIVHLSNYSFSISRNMDSRWSQLYSTYFRKFQTQMMTIIMMIYSNKRRRLVCFEYRVHYFHMFLVVLNYILKVLTVC